MIKELLVKILAKNTASAEINKLENELEGAAQKAQRLDKNTQKATSSTSALISSIKTFAAAAVGIGSITAIFQKTIIAGIELNRQFEDMQIGISAIIAGVSQDIDALGNKLSAKQKLEISTAQAQQDMAALKLANRETTASLQELTEAYQNTLAISSSLGLSSEQTIKTVKDLANAAAAIGVPMNQLSQEIRGVFQGDTSKNSRVNQILQIKKETIEAKAATGELYTYLEGVLKDYAEVGALAAKSLSGIKSNLQDTIDTILAESTKGIYEAEKNFLSEFEEYLSQNQDAIISYGEKIADVLLRVGNFAVSALKDIGNILSSLWSIVKQAASGWESLGVMIFGTGEKAASTLTVFQKLEVAISVISVGVNTLTTAVSMSVEGFVQLVYWAEYAFIKAQNALGFGDEWSKQRIKELDALIEASNKKLDDMADRWIDKAMEPSRLIAQMEAQDTATVTPAATPQTSLVAKPFIDEEGIVKQKKLIEKATQSFNDYIAETNRAALQDKYDREIFIETEKYAKMLELKGLNNKQKEQLTQSYTERIERIELEAAKNSAKNREEAELAYYKALGDKDKVREIEYKRFLDSLEKLNLSADEKELLAQKKLFDEEQKAQIEQLKHWGKYYEAIGESASANLMRVKRESLELQSQGYNPDEINNMQQKGNYAALGQGLGIDSSLVTQFQSRYQTINAFLTAETERINQYYGETEEGQLNHALKLQELSQAEFDARVATAGAGFAALSSLAKMYYDASGGENKKALRAMQALQVAQAIMNTYTSATNAMASAGNPYLGAAMAALAIAQGMAQVAQIKAQKFHSGGIVTGRGEEVPAILQTGEGVISRRGMRALDNINNGNVQSTPPEVNITVANLNGTDEFAQFLQSRRGQEIIQNIRG
jgi:hypothetical protein